MDMTKLNKERADRTVAYTATYIEVETYEQAMCRDNCDSSQKCVRGPFGRIHPESLDAQLLGILMFCFSLTVAN
jgi:hypothetical protein